MTNLFTFLSIVLIISETSQQMPSSFDYIHNIDPSIQIFARYSQSINFVGKIIDGYKANTAIITKEAGAALSRVHK